MLFRSCWCYFDPAAVENSILLESYCWIWSCQDMILLDLDPTVNKKQLCFCRRFDPAIAVVLNSMLLLFDWKKMISCCKLGYASVAPLSRWWGTRINKRQKDFYFFARCREGYSWKLRNRKTNHWKSYHQKSNPLNNKLANHDFSWLAIEISNGP